jgi:thiol peroxidase
VGFAKNPKPSNTVLCEEACTYLFQIAGVNKPAPKFTLTDVNMNDQSWIPTKEDM